MVPLHSAAVVASDMVQVPPCPISDHGRHVCLPDTDVTSVPYSGLHSTAFLQEDVFEEEDDDEDEGEDDDDDIEFMDEDSPKINKGKRSTKKANVIDVSDDDDAPEVVPPPKKRRALESAKPAAKSVPARALPASVSHASFSRIVYDCISVPHLPVPIPRIPCSCACWFPEMVSRNWGLHAQVFTHD